MGQIPYNAVKEAKIQCYSAPVNEWTINDTSAEIELQKLLNHTALRMIQANSLSFDLKNLTLHVKVGFEGSSGQTLYKQKSHDFEIKLDEEKSIFIYFTRTCKLTSNNN